MRFSAKSRAFWGSRVRPTYSRPLVVALLTPFSSQSCLSSSYIEAICGAPPLDSIAQVEPVGPKKLLDLLVVAPATGNTLAKLAAGIADTPVTLACKSHLRNGRPIVLAVSTNDALGANAASIGALLPRRHYYFVPFGQDAPEKKPTSMVADMSRIPETVKEALAGRQLQPMILGCAYTALP